MRHRRRRASSRPDPAGAWDGWRPSLLFLAIAVGSVAGALAWWWTSAGTTAVAAEAASAPADPVVASKPAARDTPPPLASASIATAALPVAPPAPPPPVGPVRERDADPTPDLSDYVNRGERPTMNQVIERLHQAGVHSGLGAFPAPGTRPPLVGLAVPEDFVLPDGYVRHYQATDDGQRIEPILMFAPDRQFVDAAGRPVAIPADRVVPPELAPPGLALRRIAIPSPAGTGRPGG